MAYIITDNQFERLRQSVSFNRDALLILKEIQDAGMATKDSASEMINDELTEKRKSMKKNLFGEEL